MLYLLFESIKEIGGFYLYIIIHTILNSCFRTLRPKSVSPYPKSNPARRYDTELEVPAKKSLCYVKTVTENMLANIKYTQ